MDVLTAVDSASGPVKVVVNNSGVLSAPFSANLKSVAPALLQFTSQGYVIATHSDYTLLAPASLYAGISDARKALRDGACIRRPRWVTGERCCERIIEPIGIAGGDAGVPNRGNGGAGKFRGAREPGVVRVCDYGTWWSAE